MRSNKARQKRGRGTPGLRQQRLPLRLRLFLLPALFIMACSFEYDTVYEEDEDPDMIMDMVDYVRIEDGNPIIRLRADQVRRYESKHIMEMDLFNFNQFNAAPEDVKEIPDINVRGNGGNARIETDTNNFTMKNGVFFEVKSEDITLETEELSWQDSDRHLSAPGKLTITRSDGTTLEGTGFSAETRKKSWEFETDVEGSVVDDD